MDCLIRKMEVKNENFSRSVLNVSTLKAELFQLSSRSMPISTDLESEDSQGL